MIKKLLSLETRLRHDDSLTVDVPSGLGDAVGQDGELETVKRKEKKVEVSKVSLEKLQKEESGFIVFRSKWRYGDR